MLLQNVNYPFGQNFGISPIAQQPAPIVCKGFFNCLMVFFSFFFKFLIMLSGAFAVIMFIWAGITFIIYGQDEKKRVEAKNRLIWCAIGLIVALLSYSLVVLIKNTLTKKVGLINIAYAQAAGNIQGLKPGPIGCSNLTVLDLIQGKEVPKFLLSKCIAWFVYKIFGYFYLISGLCTVAILIYAGFRYITGSEKAGDIHKMIVYAIVGFIVTILSYSIVKAIEYTLTK
jgi:uncharacterized membrane protein YjfL (UPF0719 family)